MSSLSVHGAAQVLLPPEPGLPYLRGDAGNRMTLAPGGVTCRDGVIAALEDDPGAEVQVDASGAAVLPGLVDCHTHLPFAGWRAEEYAMKVAGVPYAEIARLGGGIRSSARMLAEMPDGDVLGQARGLADEMLRLGTTAFECKSGYGLSLDAERRQLGLAEALCGHVPQATAITALVAHAVPEGFTPGEWLDAVEGALDHLLSAAMVTALDCFIESVAFDNAALERVGAMAADRGLWLRAHVEQLGCHRSVPVAVANGARSVDHLSMVHADDVALLGRAECAAVLLPSAEVLNDEHAAPGRALLDAGAIGVLATDLNPGTSPVTSLPLVMGLAVRRYRWTALEAAAAVTLNAAWVMGQSSAAGSLEPGKRADLVILDAPLEHVPYRLGHDPVEIVVVGGRVVHVRPGSEWRLGG